MLQTLVLSAEMVGEAGPGAPARHARRAHGGVRKGVRNTDVLHVSVSKKGAETERIWINTLADIDQCR